MRGIKRRWLLPEPDGGRAATTLSALNLPPLVERVLLARGFRDHETVQRFCEPKLTHLHDPALLPGVEPAAERFVRAIRADERIVIYGDYDVDGITATSILYHVIRAAAPQARLSTYVPHRIDEGYGLGAEALRQIRAAGADLVVSVDCGITAAEPVRAARDAGLEVIVTDHHHLPPEGEPLPEAILVHPRLPGSEYPFGDLCGAGVAYKLAWWFARCWCDSDRVSENLQKTLLNMLPLAALGTIADVVPLVGENRILTAFGLSLIKSTPIIGLQALIHASDLAGEHIDSQKVGYVLAPRLNACGRMGHAEEAVRLLTVAEGEEAREIAERLTRLNKERQSTERRIVDQAMRMAEDAGMTGDDRRAIVLAAPDWHPGVIGIVCSRLVDRFGRPAILMQQGSDCCRGSARSIDGYSMHDALAANARLLDTFGGHEMAAGLALDPEHLEAFTEALIEHANSNITVEQLTPTLRIDCDGDLHELDEGTVRHLGRLSPFGRSNRSPTIRVCGAVLESPPQPMGGEGRHLALRIRQEREGVRKVIRGVWWGNGALASDLAVGARLDVAIEPKINNWRGRVSVEAEVRDVRRCEV